MSNVFVFVQRSVLGRGFIFLKLWKVLKIFAERHIFLRLKGGSCSSNKTVKWVLIERIEA